jgi:hypothetical protein
MVATRLDLVLYRFGLMKTFDLLYFKAQTNFVAGLGTWLGFSSNWGHHLARTSHQKLETPMKCSQIDRHQLDTDFDLVNTFTLNVF